MFTSQGILNLVLKDSTFAFVFKRYEKPMFSYEDNFGITRMKEIGERRLSNFLMRGMASGEI